MRQSPGRFVGQTLEWRLQLIAVQTADELRPEMPPGQPYLLTRGPLPEPGFVYVTVPRRQVARVPGAAAAAGAGAASVAIRAARTRYLDHAGGGAGVGRVSGMDGQEVTR